MMDLIVTKEKLEFSESENFTVPTPISSDVWKGAWYPAASCSMHQSKWVKNMVLFCYSQTILII